MTPMVRVAGRVIFLMLFAACSAGATVSGLEGFLSRHCLDCHDSDVQKGGLNLEALGGEMRTAEQLDLWTLIHDRVKHGEMPPAKKKRPSTNEIAGFLGWIKPRLVVADRERREVVQRRLNREEYQNTINDLLGLDVDLKRHLPADQESGGFDNNGAALALSTELMERYLSTARMAIDAAIVSGPKPKTETFTASAMKEVERYFKTAQYGLVDGRIVLYLTARGQYSKVSTRAKRTPVPGRYRFRFTAATHRSDQPMVFSVVASDFDRAAAVYRDLGYFEVGSEPKVYEIEAELDRKWAIQFFAQGLPIYLKEPARGNYPGIGFSEVEITGPLNKQWPPASHRQLLGDTDLAKGTEADARTILERFMPRAFRRPVAETEIERYVELVRSKMNTGGSFDDGIRNALIAVLCSPNFLYLHEERTPQRQQQIADHELATRLSYFLWSSLPDKALTRAVATGGLRNASGVKRELDRMLADQRAERLVRNFTGQWLHLRDIEETTPDRKLYPEFDEFLQVSMVEEGEALFREVLDKNLNVSRFLDTDFAMLNGRLARHYGIDGVKGRTIRRVVLPGDSVRGGVLTMGALMKVTANGTTTSPVTRGVWVLENILGQTVPSPPPNISGIEPDIRGAETVREMLDLHRSVESCNSCHRKIDPSGFALESFDPVGKHRAHYLRFFVNAEHADKGWGRVGKGSPVDATGTLPDGRPFADIREFKRLLLDRGEDFARCLTTKLLAYALGREMGFSDRDAIEAVVTENAASGHGLRSLLHSIVASPLFVQP
jgi:hypothetical protein